MRTSAAFLLATFLLYPAGAMAAPATPLPLSKPPILTPAKLVCGMVDGKLRCKNVKDGTIGIEIDDGKKKKDAPGKTDDDAEGGEAKGGAGGGGGGGADDANGNAEDGGAGGGGGGGTADDTDAEEAKGCPPGYNTLPEPTKYGSVCEPPEGLPNNAYKSCPTGATGTPPNCTCPGQSDYGDKGNKCLRWTGACGTGKAGWYFEGFCKPAEKKECNLLPDGQEKCCCKTYN